MFPTTCPRPPTFRSDEEREINHHGRPVEVGETKKTKKNTKKTKKTKKINNHGRPVEVGDVGDGEEGTGPGSSSDKVGRKKLPRNVFFNAKKDKKGKKTEKKKDKKTNKATPQTKWGGKFLCFILMPNSYRKWSSLLINNRWFLFLRRTWLQ